MITKMIWTSFSNRFLQDKLGQNWGHFDIIYKVKYALRISFQKHVSFLIRFALVLDPQNLTRTWLGMAEAFEFCRLTIISLAANVSYKSTLNRSTWIYYYTNMPFFSRVSGIKLLNRSNILLVISILKYVAETFLSLGLGFQY